MNPTTYAYDTSRHYVMDCRKAGLIEEQEANRILGWIRQRNLKSLSSCSEIQKDGDRALSCHQVKVLMQVEAFFKKNAVYRDAAECREAAFKSFLNSEKICRITNRRLDYYYVKRDRLDPDLNLWMSRVSRYIDLVLGSFKPFLEEIPHLVRVTAGATSTRARRSAFPPVKVGKRPICTNGAQAYLQALSHYWGYGQLACKVTDWNRVEFVRKNWKTDRTIACEPDGNIPFQLAFDTYCKRRLRRFGIDLSDQSKNRRLAYESSKDGSLATVDIKTASDTCAYNAVAWTFPMEWFKYLDAVRSPRYRVGKHDIEGVYAKFSSMGNGATFCIETLLFAAACYAVGSKRFSVYGDDIIIETELYEDLTKLLRFLGFAINSEKSFTTGPFRESCGGNYYDGVDVTPFYLREVDSRKAIQCHNVNGLASIAVPYGKLWSFLKAEVSAEKLPLVPFQEGSLSGVWIDSHSAYSLGLIKHRRKPSMWIPQFKAYCLDAKSIEIVDSRALFLWYVMAWQDRRMPIDAYPRLKVFDKESRGFVFPTRPVHIEEPLISSSYTTSGHKYVRKWVSWKPPATVAPAHLYGWADYLIRTN